MNINPQIFKSYDIRGIYPTDLNEEVIKDIAKAIYTLLKKDKPQGKISIVIGRDMRISSPALFETASQTLKEMGARVIDIGIVSTPTLYFSVFHYGYDGGFQITASHNPKEWNGIKIVKKNGNGLIKIGKNTGMEEIKKIATEKSFAETTEGGLIEKKDDVLSDEFKNALEISGNPTIKSFKVVADAANSMGSQYINKVFEKIPGKLVRLNFELDGSFPAHHPDPLIPENLVQLKQKVLEEKADLGLAPDGDGDRLFFVDEKGNTVPATIITCIVASELLKKHPGETILYDIRFILTPNKLIPECGGKTGVTKVGHALITEALNETDGIFAGESSGHYYFRANGNTESQIPVILTILKVMSDSGKSMSELVEMYRRSYQSEEINFKTDKGKEIIDFVKEKYKDGQINTMDGVSVDYPNWRLLTRTSNTEPLLRLTVEAFDKKLMEEKRDELVELIKSLS